MLCKACKIFVHKNSYKSHFKDKKHLEKQSLYDKLTKTLLISGENGAESTSDQPDPPVVLPGFVGVPELQIKIPDSSDCPQNQNVFHWMIYQILSQIELPEPMYEKLDIVKADIEDALQSTIPGCSVFVFGSCVSRLAFKNGDVDLFVQAVKDQPNQFVRIEAKELCLSRLMKISARIPNARIPVVRLQHISTGWECNVTAHNSLCVSNSLLIRFLTSLDDRVRPLVMLVKYWAKVEKLTGCWQTKFTSYSLEILVVFFLQQVHPPILPPIAMLQQLADPEERTFECGWDCSFCDDTQQVLKHFPRRNSMTLKELLTGFFCFYEGFDYEQVICPLLGRPIELVIFDNLKNVPPEMKLYEKTHKIKGKRFLTDSSIRMQDPFQLGSNITSNVRPATYYVLRNACKLSIEICKNTPDELLLEKLFSVKMAPIMPPAELIKLHIGFEKCLNIEYPESQLLEWYNITTEAVLLIFREFFRLDVKMKSVENSHKVQKTEAKQDVHTLEHNEDSIYLCTGLSKKLMKRKETLELLNQTHGLSLPPFEREICVSHLMNLGRGEKTSFNMVIPSYEHFKQNCKGIDLTFIVNERKLWNKSLENFLIRNLLRFIGDASSQLQHHGEQTQQLLKDIVDSIKVKTGFRALKEDPVDINKMKTGCNMDINISCCNKAKIKSYVTSIKSSSPNGEQIVTNRPARGIPFNRYPQLNRHYSPTHYNPRHQYRFAHYRHQPFRDYSMYPPSPHPYGQQQFQQYSAYPENQNYPNYNSHYF